MSLLVEAVLSLKKNKGLDNRCLLSFLKGSIKQHKRKKEPTAFCSGEIPVLVMNTLILMFTVENYLFIFDFILRSLLKKRREAVVGEARTLKSGLIMKLTQSLQHRMPR